MAIDSMRIQINKNFAFLGDFANWQKNAITPISELSEKINSMESVSPSGIEKLIQVEFESLMRSDDFYCLSESPEISSIFMGSPKSSPLAEYFNQSENKSAFLQTAFLHEIGHAIFDPIFSRTSHNKTAKLRTIHSALSGASLADEIPPIENYEQRHFLVNYLGQRMEERFCDSLSLLASAKLGIPVSSSEELISNRSKEVDFSPYDTSSTLSAILRDIESGNIPPSSLSLRQCAELARDFALAGFRQDLSHPILSDPIQIEDLKETFSLISLGGPRFFQERLDSRRICAASSSNARDSADVNPSENRSSRLG